MRIRSVTLTAVAALLCVPTLAAAQGNPLSSIFQCQTQGNRQAPGIAIGAILGGLAGNKIADKENGLGTVLGAAVGAAAGSYVGCRMQTSDQQRAQTATYDALNRGQNAAWNNPETGTSGRINVVSNQGGQQAYNDPNNRYDDRGYDDRRGDSERRFETGAYDRPLTMANTRLAAGVQQQRAYFPAREQYTSANRVNMRSAPSTSGRVLGQIQPNARFSVIARVRGQSNDWLLVGRNGVGVGYVSAAVAQPVYAGGYADSRASSRNTDGAYRDRQGQYVNQPLCRTFDEHITTRDGQAYTERYTACQTASGEWVLQG